MLHQYQSIKAQHRDCILLYRMGDFYEMFGEDAKVASKILEITLTSRGFNTENRLPMCGVPHHSVEPYIARLLKHGHKVAIAEQTQDPSTVKGLVHRDVIRVITPGTILDPISLEAGAEQLPPRRRARTRKVRHQPPRPVDRRIFRRGTRARRQRGRAAERNRAPRAGRVHLRLGRRRSTPKNNHRKVSRH